MVWDPNDRQAEATAVGDAASLRAECEASLRRLGVDRIDLYQVHWPPTDGTALEDYWATLVDLRASGKVRAIGLSNHAVDQLTRAEAVGHVDSLQPPLSAINRAAAADVIPWCEANDTGVIVYSPSTLACCRARSIPSRLAPGDWRLGEADFTSDLPANLGVAAAGRRRGGRALDERGERRDRLDAELARRSPRRSSGRGVRRRSTAGWTRRTSS